MSNSVKSIFDNFGVLYNNFFKDFKLSIINPFIFKYSKFIQFSNAPSILSRLAFSDINITEVKDDISLNILFISKFCLLSRNVIL